MATLDPRWKEPRYVSPRLYGIINRSWGLGIALLALWACVSFFVLPDPVSGNPAVEQKLGGWDNLYYAAYGVAGCAMLAGILGRQRCEALEAFGLCLFIAGLCVNVAAVVSVVGLLHFLDGLGSWLAYVIGATGRLMIVARFVRRRSAYESLVEDLGLENRA